MEWSARTVAAIVALMAAMVAGVVYCRPGGEGSQGTGEVVPISLVVPSAFPWPLDPGTTTHVVGNQHGQYMDPGPNVHLGLDILPAGNSKKVYAAADGIVVKKSMDPGLQAGLVIGEPGDGGTGLVYWHLKADSIQFKLDDVVLKGQELGKLVRWDPLKFRHLHFEYVEGEGPGQWNTYESITSPATRLDPYTDTFAPTFVQGTHGSSIRFFEDAAPHDEVDPEALSGKVDVVVRIQDLQWSPGKWKLIPHKSRVRILASNGDEVFVRVLAINGVIKKADRTAIASVIYRTSSPQKTKSTTDQHRKFFLVLTNSDGDACLETTDAAECWDTTQVPDGDYAVHVITADVAGTRTAEEPLTVTVDNSP